MRSTAKSNGQGQDAGRVAGKVQGRIDHGVAPAVAHAVYDAMSAREGLATCAGEGVENDAPRGFLTRIHGLTKRSVFQTG